MSSSKRATSVRDNIAAFTRNSSIGLSLEGCVDLEPLAVIILLEAQSMYGMVCPNPLERLDRTLYSILESGIRNQKSLSLLSITKFQPHRPDAWDLEDMRTMCTDRVCRRQYFAEWLFDLGSKSSKRW